MSKPLSLTRLLALLCALLVSFCSAAGTETDNPASPEGVEFLRSSKAYLSSVDVPDQDQQSLQQGNLAFALDLYRQLAASAPADENLFLSPYSISTIMAMTQAGARGQTEIQIASALHFDLDQQALHPAMNRLAQHFNQIGDSDDFRFKALNSIWLQRDFPVEEDYLDVLSQHYDTGVYLVDFASDADGTRQRINQWVYEQTEERIDELLPQGSIRRQSVLALTNTVFLSALWEHRFDEETTREDLFTLVNGDQVTVQMMGRSWDFPFSITSDWRAVELPYKETNVSMICIMPNQGEFAEFEQGLGEEELLEIIASLGQGEMLSLGIPKFEFESAVDLKDGMQNLGMTDAFSQDGANFSGISTESPPLYIDAAVHKTFIAIDEKGTVAAAATGEVLVPLSINPRIRLERPFIFLIWDHDTQTVLFVGKLVRPQGPVAGQAPPPVSDAEAICQIKDECQGRTLTLQECMAGLDGDDPAVVEQCADCYVAETDRCGGSSWCVCEQPVCVDECPAHEF